MQVGELNRRIEVLEQVERKDSYGGIVGEWITVGAVWAKIIPLKGTETLENKEVSVNQEFKITVRFYAGLSAKHRIKYLSNIYEITSIVDEETSHRWTTIYAKELDSGKL